MSMEYLNWEHRFDISYLCKTYEPAHVNFILVSIGKQWRLINYPVILFKQLTLSFINISEMRYFENILTGWYLLSSKAYTLIPPFTHQTSWYLLKLIAIQ